MNEPLVIIFLLFFFPTVLLALGFFVFLKKSILGTRPNRRTYRRKIIERAKSRLKRFDELHTIQIEIKEKLRPIIRNFEVKLASLYIRDRACIRIALILTLIVSILSIYISMYASVRLLNVDYSVVEWIGIIQLSFLIFLISFLVVFIPFLGFVMREGFIKYLRVPAFTGFIWLGGFLVICLIIIHRIFYSYHYNTPSFQVHAIFTGLVTCISFLISTGVVLLLSCLFILLFVRKQKSIYPEAFLVDGLLQILSFLEKNPNKWMDLPFKRKLMSGIEKISICIETDIVSQLSTSDTVTDFWLKQTFVRIASGIRSLKKWICTPKADTYNEVTKFIANTLINVVKGNWDNLTQAQPEKISKPQFFTQITVWLRVLIMGIVPLLGLWIIQKTSLAFEGAILSYLRVGGYIWAAITFLTLFDPLIHEKMGAVKDILSILPGFRKEKNKE